MARTTLTPRDPQQLRVAMAQAGFDGVRLAEAAGITKQFVSLILRGRRRCSTPIAATIARALGQHVHTLFVTPASYEYPHNNQQEDRVPPNVALIENDDPYLGFDQVAELVNIKPKTLRHLRATGVGPPFHKRGHLLMISRSKALAWYRDTYEHTDA